MGLHDRGVDLIPSRAGQACALDKDGIVQFPKTAVQSCDTHISQPVLCQRVRSAHRFCFLNLFNDPVQAAAGKLGLKTLDKWSEVMNALITLPMV